MWGYTDCRAVSELLWNYTAHRLSEPDIERVELHLANCGPCRAEAEAYRQTVDALASMRQHPIPDSQRGWHELRARLSTPQRRTVSAPLLWKSPLFAWGMAAAAGGLVFIFLSPAGNTVRTPGADGKGGLKLPVGATGARTARTVAAPEVEASNNSGIDADILAALADKSNNQPRPAGTSIARFRSLRHTAFHPARLALGGPSTRHRQLAGIPARTRSARTLDYAHMDGRPTANTRDNSDYVLTPVSVASESDSATDYVMGSVVMSGRSTDTEVARGW